MKRRLLALACLVAALAALLGAPAVARAAETIVERYQVTVRVDPRGGPAHFELDLTYHAPSEVKTTGFKLVGKQGLSKLSARGPDGASLRATAQREAMSGEDKIDFDVPRPDARGRQRVIVSFDQPLETVSRFDGRVAVVPWAPQFRIPVAEMILVVEGADAASGDGLRCDGARRCTMQRDGAFEVAFHVGEPSTPWLVAWIAALALSAVGFVVAAVRYKERLVATRGVLPPASPEAYPVEAVPAGYRVPPPLPEPESAEPVLAEADVVSLWFRAGGTLALLAAMELFLATRSLPLDVHAVLACVTVPMFAACIHWAFREGHAAWPVLSMLPAAAALIAISAVFLVVILVIAVLVAIAVAASNAAKNPNRASTAAAATGGFFATSGSSSSTSSCSSFSSSCSSSSCGGGGGSSCGGGGGGGGCGG